MGRRKKIFDSNEVKIGQDQFHEIPATGSIDPEDFKDQFEIVDGPNLRAKAKRLAFMEEKVVIRIHTTSDKKRERIPCLSVNGVNQYVVRGIPQIIKRKFLAVLAQAKEDNVETPFGRDNNGFDTYNISKTQSLKYPFELIEDRNPMGRPWLDKMLSEA